MKKKRRVLFLCTHNSARSQMAEGLLRFYGGEGFEVFSAGTEKTFVKPAATAAMAAIGIDISSQQSKTLEQFLDQELDYVVTVCDDANETCPFFPNAAQRIHWSIEDPSHVTHSEQARFEAFCSTRDVLLQHIREELLER